LRRMPLLVIVMLGTLLTSVGAIGGAWYLGLFRPHPERALEIVNYAYGTASTRLDTCDAYHTTGRNTNPFGAHLKSEFSGTMSLSEDNLTIDQILGAFRAVLRDIEEMDSDNDQFSNLAEIRASTFSGDSGDYPATDRH